VLVIGHTFNHQKVRLVIPVSAKMTLYILKDGSPVTVFRSLGCLFGESYRTRDAVSSRVYVTRKPIPVGVSSCILSFLPF